MYNMVTVMNAGATQNTVSNLKKFTKYEFFLVPFFKSVEGQPSNTKIVQTLEDGKIAILKVLILTVNTIIQSKLSMNSTVFGNLPMNPVAKQ